MSQNDLMIHGYNAEKQNSSSSDYPWQNIEIPPIFFQQENCKFLLQKEIVLRTIVITSLPGEKSLFLSTLPTFIQKGKMVGLPKVTFGLPNLQFSQCLIFKKILQKLLNYYKVDRSFMRRVQPDHLRTSSTLLLQQQFLRMRMAPGTEC